MDTDYDNSIRFPVWEIGISSIDRSTDIHPHTSYTDGSQQVQQSIEEALEYGVWEKGAIEHGNPVDEDIVHQTAFLSDFNGSEETYASGEGFTWKYENLEEMMEDKDHTTLLNYVDPEKLREDTETLRRVQENEEIGEEDILNYKMVIPHGVELDYNPAIEGSEDEEPAVDSYEEEIIDFLKKAESLNTGFNYVLASSHYVNTPFRPRYVKTDALFRDMSMEDKREVLENYKKKEIHKINSLSNKLGDMEVPRISRELMDPEEREELKEFIYGQSSLVDDYVDRELTDGEIADIVDESLDKKKPGVIVVGAHPTLIERNEELMDVFREVEALTTTEEIRDEVEEFIYDTSIDSITEADLSSIHEGEVSQEEVNSWMTESDLKNIYPAETLLEYYSPIVSAAEEADNFIFEVNGKGVERQIPSVFWYMLDEKLFGSDAHRPMEQPDRSEEYAEASLPGETSLLAEKWLEQLDDDEIEVLEDYATTGRRVKRELEA